MLHETSSFVAVGFFVFLQLDANSYTIVVYVAKCKS
jgi:hypothetical protein